MTDSVDRTRLKARIREMREVQKLSVATIARNLGITKNVVTGHITRMQPPITYHGEKPFFVERTKPITTPKKERPPRPDDQPVKPDRFIKPIAKVLPPTPLGKVRGCQWPIGEPKEPGFRFCGARPVVPGKPYCLKHARIAFIDIPPRRPRK